MEYIKEIYINTKTASKINEAVNWHHGIDPALRLDDGEVISNTVIFGDGMAMDIACIGNPDEPSDDPFHSAANIEAVLFKNGNAVGVSDTDVIYTRPWKIPYNGNIYTVIVRERLEDITSLIPIWDEKNPLTKVHQASYLQKAFDENIDNIRSNPYCFCGSCSKQFDSHELLHTSCHGNSGARIICRDCAEQFNAALKKKTILNSCKGCHWYHPYDNEVNCLNLKMESWIPQPDGRCSHYIPDEEYKPDSAWSKLDTVLDSLLQTVEEKIKGEK